MILQLTWRNSGEIAFELRADQTPVTLGRGYQADLSLNDKLLSRQHCRLVWSGEGFVVADLDSTNGTILNGATVEDAPLEDGDVLLLGEVELVVRLTQVPSLASMQNASC